MQWGLARGAAKTTALAWCALVLGLLVFLCAACTKDATPGTVPGYDAGATAPPEPDAAVIDGGASDVFAPTPAPTPVLGSVTPTRTPAGTPVLTVSLKGSGFEPRSAVELDGAPLPTSYVSPTELLATLPSAKLVNTGVLRLVVRTNPPGGGTSAELSFFVENPKPIINAISPLSTIANSPAITLTVSGAGFVSASVIKFDGAALPTTFKNKTTLEAVIPNSKLGTSASYSIVVDSPPPGGGASTTIAFTVTNPNLILSTVLPSSQVVGGPNTPIALAGSGFLPGCEVLFNGVAIATTFVNATDLTATIPSNLLGVAGDLPVAAKNPGNGGVSAPITFNVQYAPPTISNLSPNSATAGSNPVPLTVSGTGFAPTSVISVDNVALATTFVSATQLTAIIPAGQLTNGGSLAVRVVTPPPGGGTSAPSTFTVNNAAPTLSGINPSTKVQGSADTEITLTGTNFVPNSAAGVEGVAMVTTYVSATQLKATVPASRFALPGALAITVVNPAPGGGQSAAQTLTVSNPSPALNQLAPLSTVAGSADTLITATGTGFVASSVLRFDGVNLVTNFVSATQLTATVPAAKLAASGSFNVVVVSPTPGGGTSPPVAFTVTDPAVTVANVAPATRVVGSAATGIAITGTGFVMGSQAKFNGGNMATTFVSATQLTATVAVGQLATVGDFPITVTNPGGAVSNPFTFRVENPVPVLDFLNPAGILAGSAALDVTLNGSNFVASSQVTLDGANINTTFLSATQLRATIPAANMLSGGTLQLRVVNAVPGGGTSDPAAFTVANPSPTITTIDPGTIDVGSDMTPVIVTGTGFVPTTTARAGAQQLVVAYMSATQLRVEIPAALLVAPATLQIRTTNGVPGGGTSLPFQLTVACNSVGVDVILDAVGIATNLPTNFGALVSFQRFVGGGDCPVATTAVPQQGRYWRVMNGTALPAQLETWAVCVAEDQAYMAFYNRVGPPPTEADRNNCTGKLSSGQPLSSPESNGSATCPGLTGALGAIPIEVCGRRIVHIQAVNFPVADAPAEVRVRLQP